MPVLFTAIDLPIEVRERLGALVPAGVPGLRVVPPDDMHVTLHYLGEGEAGVYESALATVRAASFRIALDGVGLFEQPGGASVWWMGLKPSAELAQLHRVVGEALGTVGFMVDRRPFTPHVTLARAGKGCSRESLKRWLSSGAELRSEWDAREFALYSSRAPVEGQPRYVKERTFALR